VAQARQDLGRNLHQHRRLDIVCQYPHSTSGRVDVLVKTIARWGMANVGLRTRSRAGQRRRRRRARTWRTPPRWSGRRNDLATESGLSHSPLRSRGHGGCKFAFQNCSRDLKLVLKDAYRDSLQSALKFIC
jgi:hypothetical protein